MGIQSPDKLFLRKWDLVIFDHAVQTALSKQTTLQKCPFLDLYHRAKSIDTIEQISWIIADNVPYP